MLNAQFDFSPIVTNTRKTYQLAKLRHIGGKPESITRRLFGPLMTLSEAQHWQRELTNAGKDCVIINKESI